MTVVTLVGALLYLTALGISGVAVLRRLTCQMTTLEKWTYGFPLGNVAWSLVILLLAIVARQLTVQIVILPAIASVAVALWLWPWGDIVAAFKARQREARKPDAEPPSPAEYLSKGLARLLGSVGPLSAFVLALFAVRWTILWRGALTTNASGLWAGHINIWGDWALHLGDVTSFVYGDNFPPVNSRYLGGPLAYHYLPSITAAALVKLGMEPTTALAFHSWFFCLTILLGLYAFALRLTRDRNAAGLSILLFLFGGTLGWLFRIAAMDKSHNLWGTFWQQPWDRNAANDANFRWPNMFFDLIESQRAYVYGLPLCLLILTLLLEGQAQRSRRLFVAAGLVAATLPFAHTSTLVALALIIPFLCLFLPLSSFEQAAKLDLGLRISRTVSGIVADYRGSLVNWVVFGTIWVALTVPQIYLQQGGQRGETNSIRWLKGWIAPPDPWPWFWLKNLGWFIPLLIVGLILAHKLVDGPARRLIWAFMPTFVLCNLIAFRPWDWDNTKMLFYWFLAVCILVAALIVRAWREQGSLLVRTLIVGTVATMILTGVLMNVQQLLGKDRYELLSTDEIHLAEEVREKTDPRAAFVVGTQHNHPVPVLAGRQVLMSYTGWLFAFGIDYGQRLRDQQAIYALAPNAQSLIEQYGIDYVVIGPGERSEFKPNVAQFRARYGAPFIATGQYEIYKVR
ncbi:MAG: hypothetical protein U0232_25625 [Thermomicrobiales bacterium]